ncbi:hypothetical protein L5I01_17365 [Gordonia sp. HY442]|uniref:hypothetical protein n=1 Tax=Gordonia zhenghanii TaxID=2911516 RepID=UPI001F260E24|nr:hypothetical protein [Gordonia zhenghanii]MCF8605126.1 hypothetical protein [Gordonia zhenghanii]
MTSKPSGEFDIDRRVGDTDVGEVRVSTVWMGIDHNMTGVGPPLIFETMLFVNDDEDEGDYRHNALVRYATEEEALRGHLAAVDALRDGRELDWWARPDGRPDH